MYNTKEWLEAARADQSTWANFAYAQVQDNEDPRGVWDDNDIPRSMLLRELQRDFDIERDHDLIRYLFDAEVHKHQLTAANDMDDSLALAAYLLAAFRDVADVWRMAAAKFANEGTAARFEPEHLIAAGLQPTIDHIRATEHPLKTQLLYYFFDEDDSCHLEHRHVDGWWADKCITFAA